MIASESIIRSDRNGETASAGCETELSDEALAERVRLGETALFELIMRRHNRRLYRLARALLGGDGVDADNEAEDIVQEAYVRAYTHLDQFEGRARFATWLTRICANVARARIRFRRRERRRLAEIERMTGRAAHAASAGGELVMLPQQHTHPVPRPDDRACAAELRDAIATALQALPRPMRSVFMLREVEGLDTDQTAQCLGISTANVKVRLHRARGQLRGALERALGAETRSLYDIDGGRCHRIVARVFAQLEAVARGRDLDRR